MNSWSYDANGNTTGKPGFSGSYDVENRLQVANAASSSEEYYGYGADNRRVYQGRSIAGTGATQELVTFWSGGKRTVTPGETEKYATYMHDGRTDLAYADQRYYATGAGRFMTADPAGDGLNWYAYVGGDPVNGSDPRGLTALDDLNNASLLMLPDGGFLNVGGSGAWNGGSIHWAEAEARYASNVDTAFAVNALNSGVLVPNSPLLGILYPNADLGSIVAFPSVQIGTVEAPSSRVVDYFCDQVRPFCLDAVSGGLKIHENLVPNIADATVTSLVAATTVTSLAGMRVGWIAVGPGQPIHMAFGVGLSDTTWYHAAGRMPDQVFRTIGADAWAGTAWAQFPIPIFNPAGALSSINQPVMSCVTSVLCAAGGGLVPFPPFPLP